MTIRTPTQPPISHAPVKIELQTSPVSPAAAGSARAPSAAPGMIAFDATPARVPLWRRAAPWLVVFLVCCGWDRAIWLMVTRNGTPKLEWLENLIKGDVFWAGLKAAVHLDLHAIGNTLLGSVYWGIYTFGQLGIWIAFAVFFIFRHWGGTDGAKVREGMRRGVFVFLVPAFAGAAAEAMKFLLRRERPEAADGMYAFLRWPEASPLSPAFWSTEHLGLASSHAAVAFGGALAAGLLLPRWRAPLLGLAVLCTISRISVGAHFLSDAFAGAALACAMFALVYAWDRRNNGGRPIAA
jgi:membrane-associated phospholipid phosphatase